MRYSYDVNREIRTQLSKYNAFKSKLQNIHERLEEIEQFTGVQSVKYDQQQNSNVRDSKGSIYAKQIELKEKLLEEQCELTYTIENIEAALDSLRKNQNDKLIKVIEMRYFDNMNVSKICEAIYIDKSTFYRYESKAFDIIRAYMPL